MVAAKSQLLGYARVSIVDQNPDLQLDALRDSGCWRIWTDHASGRLDHRPQLDAVLKDLQRRIPNDQHIPSSLFFIDVAAGGSGARVRQPDRPVPFASPR
jgi:hypothetical protein